MIPLSTIYVQNVSGKYNLKNWPTIYYTVIKSHSPILLSLPNDNRRELAKSASSCNALKGEQIVECRRL